MLSTSSPEAFDGPTLVRLMVVVRASPGVKDDPELVCWCPGSGDPERAGDVPVGGGGEVLRKLRLLGVVGETGAEPSGGVAPVARIAGESTAGLRGGPFVELVVS